MTGHRDRDTRHNRAQALAAICAVAALAALTPTPTPALAAEEETHFFDATLSLTGDCSTSTADPVPDPGPCPGTLGVDHPSKSLKLPKGIALDAYGNRYVASYGPEFVEPNEGRIDIFDSAGNFIGEIDDPRGPRSIAVDSEGNLYAAENYSPEDGDPEAYVNRPRIVRYVPTVYRPEAGEIEYGNPPAVVSAQGGCFGSPTCHNYEDVNGGRVGESLAIDPRNDRLLTANGYAIREYGSAAEGNEDLGVAFGASSVYEASPLQSSTTLAIDATHGRLYADSHSREAPQNVIQAFDLESHELVETIDGSTTPAGEFRGGQGEIPIAAEEATGHLFVDDGSVAKKVYELEADGGYVATIEHSFRYLFRHQIAVDNSPSSPDYRYLFVESGETTPGHSYAFEPKSTLRPPAVESVSVSGVSEDEAVLHARIDPEGSEVNYRLEYTSQQSFEAEGFAAATTAGEGALPAGVEGVAVSAPATGLSPRTAYRFRAVAESEGGEDEAQGSFATYGPPDASSGCDNQALRTGASAALPDCRAYELVTPPNTGGLAPLGLGFSGQYFATREASPAGEAVSFQIAGGTLPGLDATGSLHGDPYLASRGAEGWSTATAGPDGSEAFTITPGSHSPDQGYSFWTAEGGGSKSLGESTDYLRYPDGHSEPLGQGELGSDPQVVGHLIAAGGRHVIFSTTDFGGHVPVQLEPEAPEEGVKAIYDRTIDPASGAEAVHVVSLLPEDITPGGSAQYVGASLDGRGVAFRFGDAASNPIYLRVDDESTYLAAPAGATFAGLAEGGERLFYLEGGDLYAFDAQTESTIRFTESGDVTVVNVAGDGSAAYFVSPSVLGGQGPGGQTAVDGKENLYLSREGAISFLGMLTERDVVGKPGNVTIDGLGLWTQALSGPRPGGLAVDPSRATADGSVLLFESRAKLTAYDPEGHAEVYRYDARAGRLACLSCIPTGVAASGEASLQSVKQVEDSPEPLDQFSLVENLSPDGSRAFFQTSEALAVADTDGLQDVYEWEEEGVGSCRTEGGCVYLISSGHSGRPNNGAPNYLYAVGEGGRDAFFTTTDLLLPALDSDETPSIYDARVEGGFPPPPSQAAECLGEACQPAAVVPGDPPQSLSGAGNVPPTTQGRHCPKGKRAVRRSGKLRCLARHRHRHSTHRKHRRANAKRRVHR